MHPKIGSLLARFPRVELIGWETPIQYLPKISSMVGADVYVKRDDLTGFGIGGNKIRKLEFLLGDAIASGADTVITLGAVHSNHAFVTALAAKSLGLDVILVLRGKEELKGNYLLDKLVGIETRVFEAEKTADLVPMAEEIAEELRAEGRRPYLIPIGGASPVGTLGYVGGAGEIASQAKKLGIEFDTVVDAVGSGGTLAGITLGLSLLGSRTEPVGMGVGIFTGSMENRILELAAETRRLIGAKCKIKKPRIHDYSFGAYGKIVKEVGETIRLVAKLEGILLDPVYTGKAFHGLMELAQTGELGETVLFIHTGGTPGLFHYGEEMLRLMQNP
ncbi:MULTISPECIES: pyridoxal-phosphate dependent enzyme [Thermococcus]|uniref:1-aminocyclopropane-1-carboxylate deaminase n=1 Tax=Thermococcus barossii TaxID=54077 RepID=A0A2Z2MTC5_9EURY|nr:MULTISPECIES: pyridoxal-phosphate dependent enzyme [Thermococcus]ASJ05218.1 1-aminocyclopropane-1-carboxylate deaminase [Thermococcus barossii]NJE76350.1 pyridoxal-phosphate dependent enzyme [Thermococcus sp. ES12]